MKLNQEFWDTLPVLVKDVVLHAAKYPSERNVCYAAGYLRGAKEFGGLLAGHYAFLLAVVGDEAPSANWRDLVKGFDHAAQ